MKITRIGPSFPLLTASTLGSGGTISPAVGGGLVPVSNGSNGWAWASNIQTIQAAGSNVLGPIVNFAAGSNVTLTIDQLGAVGSNTIRIHATGGGAASFGSNSNAVSQANAPGASTDSSRADHVHLGVTSLAHSSNTFSGPVILTASGTLGITSPTPGTYNLSAGSGTSGGGGGLTQAYVGYNTVGGTWETGSVNEWAIAKQITLANACLISDVEVYLRIGAAGTMAGPAAALYADNAGAPGQILRAPPERGGPTVSQPATTPLWFGTNGLGWVAAGTYWLVVRLLDAGGTELIQVAYDAGSDRTQDFTAMAWQTWSAAAGSRKYSIRANTLR